MYAMGHGIFPSIYYARLLVKSTIDGVLTEEWPNDEFEHQNFYFLDIFWEVKSIDLDGPRNPDSRLENTSMFNQGRKIE